MATGSISVSATLPNLNGAGGPGGVAGASQSIATLLLAQAQSAIGASGATSGNLIYPPGSGTVVGTFTYSPAS